MNYSKKWLFYWVFLLLQIQFRNSTNFSMLKKNNIGEKMIVTIIKGKAKDWEEQFKK